MSRILSLLLFLGFVTPIFAQNLSGKWVGYFTMNNGTEEKNYPYEIQISNGNNQIINAVTFTKFSNQLTASAIARGIFTPAAHLLNLQETKFEQIHLDANVQGCLMNNYLSYQNNNGRETLTGTFIAKNAMNGTDCGMGTIYLARDLTNRIVKLEKKKDRTIAASKNNQPAKPVLNKSSNQSPIVKDSSINSITLNSEMTIHKDSTSFGDGVNSVGGNGVSSNFSKLIASSNTKTNPINIPANIQKQEIQSIAKHQHILMPWVIIARENILVKKIITQSKTFSFDLFDNGTIDNDTITIYDNNILMLDQNRLSYKAVHFDIHFSDSVKQHEIILVANNLGAVPPNTALLVYKDAKQSEEIFINTNFTQNAKLIIEYQPPTNK